MYQLFVAEVELVVCRGMDDFPLPVSCPQKQGGS